MPSTLKTIFAGAVTAGALLLPATAAQAAVQGYPCDGPGFRGATFFGAGLQDSLLDATRIEGLSGDIFGPIRIGDGEALTMHGKDAESWLRSRGAEVTVRSLGSGGST